MAKLDAPVMLVILDGYGLGDKKDVTNAVEQAHPRHIQALWDAYPHTQLRASGLAVGLPEGQMGNSEVGHLNLGAGRVVYQDLTRITKDVEDGSFYEKPVIKDLYQAAQGHALHVVGLLSDGNVHCSLDHIKAVIKGAKDQGLSKVFVHALLDGRDVPPKSALTYLLDLEAYMAHVGVGRIATLGGRYYGMDRDNRWERVEEEYKAIVYGQGADISQAKTAEDVVNTAYAQGITDEFMPPVVLDDTGYIQDGDAVLYCNFRPDRGRMLTKALVLDDFDGFERLGGKKKIYMATMTKYEEGLPVHVVYEKDVLSNTLGQVLSDKRYRQLRIAETEKYAHVTYFFNGGLETALEGEDRILVNSPKVATYDMKPSMSAQEVTDRVLEVLDNQEYDVIILNFANPDMVGHTGNFEAAVEAIQTVDACVAKIADRIRALKGHLLITADHGNAEVMVDHRTGSPHTAHTTNEVPCILVSDAHKGARLHEGALCDVAPTLLALGGIEKPGDMTGQSLLDD